MLFVFYNKKIYDKLIIGVSHVHVLCTFLSDQSCCYPPYRGPMLIEVWYIQPDSVALDSMLCVRVNYLMTLHSIWTVRELGDLFDEGGTSIDRRKFKEINRKGRLSTIDFIIHYHSLIFLLFHEKKADYSNNYFLSSLLVYSSTHRV